VVTEQRQQKRAGCVVVVMGIQAGRRQEGRGAATRGVMLERRHWDCCYRDTRQSNATRAITKRCNGGTGDIVVAEDGRVEAKACPRPSGR
jgi:hypothetical protein